MNKREIEKRKSELIGRIELRRQILSTQTTLIKLAWSRTASASQSELPGNSFWWILGPCAANLILKRQFSIGALVSAATAGLRLGRLVKPALRNLRRLRQVSEPESAGDSNHSGPVRTSRSLWNKRRARREETKLRRTRKR